MTSEEFWQAEVERLEEKFAQSGDVCDQLQAEASRIMLDPTHAGGFEMALDHAILMASVDECEVNE